MKKNIKIIFFWVIIPVLLLTLAFGIDAVGFNNRLLGLPEAQKGIQPVDFQAAEGNQYVINTSDLYVNKISIQAQASDIFQYTLQYNGISNQSYYVPRLNCDTIKVGSNTSQLVIVLPQGASLVKASIDNTLRINEYRILFFFVLFLLIYLLILFRKRISHKIEYGFLIVALAAGILITILIPANTTQCWDDLVHYFRSNGLSYLPGTAKISYASDELFESKWSGRPDGVNGAHVLDTYEDQKNYYEAIDSLTLVKRQRQYSVSYKDSGYVAPALFILIGRILNLPFHMQFILGRVGNLLQYVLICFLAIKLAARYKVIISAIALLPLSMYLAGSYNYDPTVTALSLLGFSLVITETLTPDVKLTWLRAVLMPVSFFIGFCPKAVYMPMILTCLLLPSSKFKSKKSERWFRIGVIALFCLGMSTFVLPTIFNPAEKGDLRGGATSIAGQLGFILQDPLRYMNVLGKSIWDTFAPYMMDDMRNGFFLHGSGSYNFHILTAILMAFAVFTDTRSVENVIQFRVRHKIVIASVVVSIILLIWTALYLSFTPVGSLYIAGVQPRYYIPLFLGMAVLVNTPKLKNELNAEFYHLLILGGSGIVLFTTIYDLMVKRFWM